MILNRDENAGLRGMLKEEGARVKRLEEENKDLRDQLAVYKRELGMIVMSVPNVDEMLLDFEEENGIKNGYGASWEDEDESD